MSRKSGFEVKMHSDLELIVIIIVFLVILREVILPEIVGPTIRWILKATLFLLVVKIVIYELNSLGLPLFADMVEYTVSFPPWFVDLLNL